MEVSNKCWISKSGRNYLKNKLFKKCLFSDSKTVVEGRNLLILLKLLLAVSHVYQENWSTFLPDKNNDDEDAF